MSAMPPYDPRFIEQRDREHLRLLSLFHYVVAAIVALVSMFPVIHLMVGIGMVTGSINDPTAPREMFDMMGWFFITMAGLIIVLGLTLAVCMVIAGRCLASQTHYTFCLIVAALECLYMPFGTILGIFSIIVLSRSSVKQLFEKTGK